MTPITPLRQRLFLILEPQSQQDQMAARVFSWVLTLMVLSNVMAVILESVPSIEAQYGRSLQRFDLFSVAFFSVEYLLRIWTAAERPSQKQTTATRQRLAYV
jgi:voltage-gated potassium channel